MGGRASISLFFGCYVCYYLLYGFEISMLLMFNLLLVSNLITCQLNIFVFTLHDFIPCFLAKKGVCYYCKLIKSTVYKKYSITARELVFTIFDGSVSCLSDNTKNLTLLSVVRRNDRHNNFPEIG